MSEAKSEPESPAEATTDRRRPLRNLMIAMVSAESYGLVLLLVIVTYAVSVFVTETSEYSIVLGLQIVTVWLALRTAHARRGQRLMADVLLAAVAAVALVNVFVKETDTFLQLAFVGSCLLYLVAPFAILRDIVFRSNVDQETVLGALTAYLLVGMFFAFAYRLTGAVQSAPFFGAQGKGTMASCLFFSFVTLTTTGYGNLVPAGNPGQSMAVLEALVGQLFLVTAVAKIINSWKPKRWGASGEQTQAEPEAD